jgi:ferric-dicitrate binding protein FerR (iron transport regulator)
MEQEKQDRQDGADMVASLIRAAGRRMRPPDDAYREVLAAATAAFREKTARRRERTWLLWAAAAGVAAFAIALMLQWTPPSAQRAPLARVERAIGTVERATGDVWTQLTESAEGLSGGTRIRTLAGGRAGLLLGEQLSLRLAAETEIMLDGPARLHLQRGTIYVDTSSSLPGDALEIVTPAGTARDLGTQFELRVGDGALRLRVREGAVEIDRAGKLLTGGAGEQVSIDALGGIQRSSIAANDTAWQWAESIAPAPNIEGRPATVLLAWVARETGRRLSYESAAVEARAATVILHGNIRHLAPLAALEVMLATTDLEYGLADDTMEVRTRTQP